MLKTTDKEKLLKTARKENPETFYVQKQIQKWEISYQLRWKQEDSVGTSLKDWQKKKCQPQILYPAKYLSKTKRQIKTFSDKQYN